MFAYGIINLRQAPTLDVKIEVPEDNIVFHKVGNLYPSINNGHLRLRVNLYTLDNVTRNICELRDICKNIGNLTQLTDINKRYLGTKFANQLKIMNDTTFKEAFPSMGYHSLSPATLHLLNDHCEKAGATVGLVKEILYVRPLSISSHDAPQRPKRFIAEIALLLSSFNFYEVE